jgi:virginiamycin B lyase
MRTKIAHLLSERRSLTTASRNHMAGLLTLLVLLLYSFADSASAQWSPVSAPTTMAGIRLGTTQMWGRDSAGNVYQYNKITNTLDKIPSTPSFSEIAVGKGNSVWGLDASDRVYQYNFSSKKFELIAAKLAHIAAGGQGVWGVNKSGHIYTWNGTAFVAPPHGEPAKIFTSVFVGSYEIGVWALDSKDNSYLYNTTTQFFDGPIGGGTKTDIGVGSGEVWSVNSADQVFMYDVLAEQWVEPDPSARLKEVAAASNSNIWGVNSSGEVYKLTKSTFALVSPQPPETSNVVRVSGVGTFVLSDSGQVYKH